MLGYFHYVLDLVVSLYGSADAEKPEGGGAYVEYLPFGYDQDEHDEECDKVAGIEHEVIPLEIEKEQNAVRLGCWHPAEPVLVDLYHMFYPVEELVEEREGEKPHRPLMKAYET